MLLQVISPLFTGDLTLQHSSNRRCFPQEVYGWTSAHQMAQGWCFSSRNYSFFSWLNSRNGTLLVFTPGCSFQHGNYWFPWEGLHCVCNEDQHSQASFYPRLHRRENRHAVAWRTSHDYNWKTSKPQNIQCQKCGAWCSPVILEQVHTPCHTAMTSSHTILIFPFPVAKWFVI